ncbi:MAG: hypothetical protein IH987_17810 [Planctomycetes bacterium]|nr:hypothetical protein [Planctomycetota bacterium]
MAWRPEPYLIDGHLDNTERGKVTGWIRFVGRDEKVTLDLRGEFHRDIRGAAISFHGPGREIADRQKAIAYMNSFSPLQTGRVGDITGGRPPRDYGDPYIEWYSDQNGRVVLELAPNQISVIGTPIPACESGPISRAAQYRNLADHLYRAARELRDTREANNGGRKPSKPESGESSHDE